MKESHVVTEHVAKSRWKVECNTASTNWRERLGSLLRRWAHKLDGRHALVLRLHSDPPVPIETQLDIVRKGLDHMSRCLRSAAEEASIERVLETAVPQIFGPAAKDPVNSSKPWNAD